ncbi:sulfatase-like hydrolase/transferase [Pontiella sulfatireligans]|uniref:Arylsulfatase n=1 Tax=Pontiella sulfatireligans TaxID=2750658 RepID=A0A6C2UFN6_9BACT|nr:sulfatase-like hydrolase/transferase [Pontiella sulfatireligans]SPS74119.1 sulfatase S1_15 [Kiritimatiellales bacterium]VGO18016.1 Arylsulfatase [Pontiella sulfatireligans]
MIKRHHGKNFTLLFVAGLAFSAIAERPRPNILLFFVDDMGIGDLSAYQAFTGIDDSVQIHTPTMDALAAEGILFTDTHTAASLCSPSRWGLLTGKHPWRRADVGHTLLSSKEKCFLGGEKTLPEAMQKAGYRTYGVGKWHVGLGINKQKVLTQGPLDFGFDHFFGQPHNPGINGSGPFIEERGFSALDADMKLLPVGVKGPRVKFTCAQYGQNYLDHFRKYASEVAAGGEFSGKPFFMYFSPNSNHTPYWPAEQIDGIQVIGESRTLSGESTVTKLAPLLDDHRDDQERYKLTHDSKKRGDMILENDVILGRILKWLDETDDPRYPGHKMRDNTLIVFTSDNGSDVRLHQNAERSVPAHGQLSGHKNTQFEGGHRVPFFAVWPGKIPEGKTSDLPISLLDLFATFTELAGTSPDEDAAPDSINLLPHWLNPDTAFSRKAPLITLGGKATPDMIKGEGGKDWISIRDGQFKLTLTKADFVNGTGEPVGLYDFSKTLVEDSKTNLIDNPEYAGQLKKMQKALKKAATEGRTR